MKVQQSDVVRVPDRSHDRGGRPFGAESGAALLPGAGVEIRRPTVRRLPPNFETPELLDQRRKPRLQRSLQETAAAPPSALCP